MGVYKLEFINIDEIKTFERYITDALVSETYYKEDVSYLESKLVAPVNKREGLASLRTKIAAQRDLNDRGKFLIDVINKLPLQLARCKALLS